MIADATADAPEPTHDPGPTHPSAQASAIDSTGSDPLDAIFAPRGVAVIGALDQPESLGRIALANLLRTPFGGPVYPVHPSLSDVLGREAYPTIASIPGPVDLTLIASPAADVPAILAECGRAGIRGAIVVSWGSGPDDPAAGELADQTRQQARLGRVHLLGPNSLGVMRPGSGLNASVAGTMARAGHVGFLSQPGALTASILAWSIRTQVGFSMVVAVGAMLDVGWGDLITYLGDDPATYSIVIALETVADARDLLGAARAVAPTKPIIVIMPARTGLDTGGDAVLAAALPRAGILRAHTVADVFHLAEVLASQPRPQGARLAIVTSSPEPGRLAVDALVGQGGSLAVLAPESVAALDAILPPGSGRANPVDLGAGADPARFAGAVEILAADPGTDGLLVILGREADADLSPIVAAIQPIINQRGKPVLVSWLGGDAIGPGAAPFRQAGIPTLPYPDTAARVFAALAEHAAHLRDLTETPIPPTPAAELAEADADRWARGDAIIAQVQAEGRLMLDEIESKRLLNKHGLAMVETLVASTEDEAVAAAEAIGWPVALKVYSRQIASRAEIGGVRLNLATPDAVRAAFWGIEATVNQILGPGQMLGVTVQPMVPASPIELCLSSRVDPTFGPVIGCVAVGSPGGPAVALPPLTLTLARRLLDRAGIRTEPPNDLDPLARFLVGFGWLIVARPRVAAVEIGPIFVTAADVLALDARVTLHPATLIDPALPRPALRPYPVEFASPWTAKDGGPVVIRPIRTEDEPLLLHLHESMVEQSVPFHGFGPLKSGHALDRDQLTRFCGTDNDRAIVLVVDRQEPWTELHEILGVGQLHRIAGTTDAEFAILIHDNHHGRGFGTELLRRLLTIAGAEQVEVVAAQIPAGNHAMIRVCEKLGVQLSRIAGSSIVQASVDVAALFSAPISPLDSSIGASPVDPHSHDPT